MPQYVNFVKDSGIPDMAVKPYIWNAQDGESIATIAAELFPYFADDVIAPDSEHATAAEKSVDVAMEILRVTLSKMEAHNAKTEREVAEHIDLHSRIVRPAGHEIGEYGGGVLRSKDDPSRKRGR